MKRVAVLQSSYVPWKGYFDLLASVDEFIFYEDAQFTKSDWRNRNLIKTPLGTKWLTVPVETKGLFGQKIRDVSVASPNWQTDHWNVLTANYRNSPGFGEAVKFLEDLYVGPLSSNLSVLNMHLIKEISAYLRIKTKLTSSGSYPLGSKERTEKLVNLCVSAEASIYVSGPKARDYLDESKFESAGIQVEWHTYGPYPEYPQSFGDFVHEVSILDLLFNCGRESHKYFRSGDS
jgi:hypothetical protein